MNLRLKIYIVFFVTLFVSLFSYYSINAYFLHSSSYISKYHFDRAYSLPEASLILLANKDPQEDLKDKEFKMIKEWVSMYTKEINFNKNNQTYSFRIFKADGIKVSNIIKKLNSFFSIKEINYNLGNNEILLTFGKLNI